MTESNKLKLKAITVRTFECEIAEADEAVVSQTPGEVKRCGCLGAALRTLCSSTEAQFSDFENHFRESRSCGFH